jgi:hypothetical protein
MPKRPLRRGISAYEKAVGPSAPMAVPVRRWLWLGLGSSSKSPHFLRESPSCMHQNSDDQGLARMYVPARTSQSRCTNKFYMYEILQVTYTFSFFHWEFGVQQNAYFFYVMGSLYINEVSVYAREYILCALK